MDKVTLGLLDDVYTSEELNNRLDEVLEASRWVYKGGVAPLSEKITGVSEEFINILRNLESDGNLPTARKDLGRLFKKAITEIEEVPALKLTLAFQPQPEFIQKIIDKYLSESSQKTVLDITVSPKIIGGCIIEYGGEYKDFSLVKQLEGAISEAVDSVK